MQVTIDPADLVLARGPIAGDRMHVAIDQAGSERGTLGVDDGGGAGGVDIFLFADGGDAAVDGRERYRHRGSDSECRR